MPLIGDDPIGHFLQRVATDVEKQTVRDDLDAPRFVPFAADHKVNDFSIENGWFGVCTTDTTDNIEPQDDGLPSNLVGLSPNTPNLFAGIVRITHEVTFTKAGFLNDVIIWPAKVAPEVNIVVAVLNDTNGSGEVLSLPPLIANQWNRIDLPQRLVVAGSVFRFIVETIDLGVSAVITGGWQKLDAIGTVPAVGQFSVTALDDFLNISEVDLDGTDRTSELAGLQTGSTFNFIETASADRSSTYVATGPPVDNGGYRTIPVTLTSTGSKGAPRNLQFCSCTFSTSAATNTDYDSIPSHFATPPTWGTVEGVVEQNGVETSRDDTAYGIDFAYQPLIASPDWTLLSIPIFF